MTPSLRPAATASPTLAASVSSSGAVTTTSRFMKYPLSSFESTFRM